MEVLAAQSCLTLSDLVDYSPPGSPVHGILQARILEWVATPFSRGPSQPRHRNWVFHISGRFFTMVLPSKYIHKNRWLKKKKDDGGGCGGGNRVHLLTGALSPTIVEELSWQADHSPHEPSDETWNLAETLTADSWDVPKPCSDSSLLTINVCCF